MQGPPLRGALVLPRVLRPAHLCGLHPPHPPRRPTPAAPSAAELSSRTTTMLICILMSLPWTSPRRLPAAAPIAPAAAPAPARARTTVSSPKRGNDSVPKLCPPNTPAPDTCLVATSYTQPATGSPARLRSPARPSTPPNPWPLALTTRFLPPGQIPAHVPDLQYRLLRCRHPQGLALGPGPTASARWSSGAIPTLENALELAAPTIRAHCLHWRIALHDDTQASPLDTADGHYEPVLARLSGSVPATIEAMSRAFTDTIAPLGSALGTCAKAARNWRTCLTWVIGRDTSANLHPMPSDY